MTIKQKEENVGFWGEQLETLESEQNAISLNDSLVEIPHKSFGQLVKEMETTKSDLDHIETIRARLYEKLIQYQSDIMTYGNHQLHEDYKDMLEKLKNPIVKVTGIEDNQILKIYLNFLSPHYPKIQTNKFSYYCALQEVYRSEISKQLVYEKNQIPNFKNSEKIFVLIKSHFRNKVITDLDNRFHSFIFNGIRYAAVIPDDNWQRLSYMEHGVLSSDGNEKTEIFVGDYSALTQIIKYAE